MLGHFLIVFTPVSCHHWTLNTTFECSLSRSCLILSISKHNCSKYNLVKKQPKSYTNKFLNYFSSVLYMCIYIAASTSSSSGNGSSVGSSGVWGMKGDSNTPSPPQIHVSNSAPTDTVFSSRYPPDEGVHVDDEPYFPDDFSSRNKKVNLCDYSCDCMVPV